MEIHECVCFPCAFLFLLQANPYTHQVFVRDFSKFPHFFKHIGFQRNATKPFLITHCTFITVIHKNPNAAEGTGNCSQVINQAI